MDFIELLDFSSFISFSYDPWSLSSAFVSFMSHRWLFNVATSFVNGPLPHSMAIFCCWGNLHPQNGKSEAQYLWICATFPVHIDSSPFHIGYQLKGYVYPKASNWSFWNKINWLNYHFCSFLLDKIIVFFPFIPVMSYVGLVSKFFKMISRNFW